MFVRGVKTMRKTWWFLLLLGFRPCEHLLPQELRARMKEPPPVQITEKFGGWEQFAQKWLQGMAFGDVVTTMLQIYRLERGEFPTSWRDLCSLSWMPVNCDLLINPFTGRKLSDQRPNEVGSLWLETKNGGTDLVWYFYQPPDFNAPKELRLRLQPWPAVQRDLGRVWKDLDARTKGAAALWSITGLVLSTAGRCARDLGWEGFVARFSVLRALRNPYTGAPLRPALWEEDMPTERLRARLRGAAPGELVVTWTRKGDLAVFDVVTEDGRLLQEVLQELRSQNTPGGN